MGNMKSDVGRFAIVPEWLLDEELSDAAVRLYAVLMCKHADRNGEGAIVRRRTLADEVQKKSVDAVDKAKRELVAVGALELIERHGADGSRLADEMRLRAADPRPGKTDGGGREKTEGGAVKNPQLEPESSNPEVSSKDETPVQQKLIDDGQPTDDAKPDSMENVRAVFAHWQQVMDHPRAQLDEKRVRVIKARLLGYTVEELKLAIDGCKLTPHNMGDNDRRTVFDGIHLIFRDADQVDRFKATANRSADGRTSVKRDRHRLGQTTIDNDAVFAKTRAAADGGTRP